MGLISANVIVCESVLSEKNGINSAIRIMDTLTIPSASNYAHFYTLTILHADTVDFTPHTIQVRMVDSQWRNIAAAPPHPFVYGYGPEGFLRPGGFVLTTEFTALIEEPGVFYIEVLLDGEFQTKVPFTVRRS